MSARTASGGRWRQAKCRAHAYCPPPRRHSRHRREPAVNGRLDDDRARGAQARVSLPPCSRPSGTSPAGAPGGACLRPLRATANAARGPGRGKGHRASRTMEHHDGGQHGVKSDNPIPRPKPSSKAGHVHILLRRRLVLDTTPALRAACPNCIQLVKRYQGPDWRHWTKVHSQPTR